MAMKPRRNRRFLKKRRTMAILKRDIRKCNFPNKVKFIGLTEKKTMFLTKEETIDGVAMWSYYLDPINTANIVTLREKKTFTKKDQVPKNAMLTNWDKFCVLGIYIKFQPVANEFNGTNEAQSIRQIKCTYTMNNVEWDSNVDFSPEAYDHENINNKQVFTFNSNEAFTLFVPAPTTMCYDSPVVHRSKTWWSLSELGELTKASRGECYDDLSEEDVEGVLETDKPFSMHCGRLHLESAGAIKYNVTFNYKVALKG